MAKFVLKELVEKILKQNAGQELTSKEIAEGIFKYYPEECYNKKERIKTEYETDKDFIGIIQGEISASKISLQKNSNIELVDGSRPMKFFYTGKTSEAKIEEVKSSLAKPEDQANGGKMSEKDLYDILPKYLKKLGVECSHIDDKKAKKGGNEWLFPDLVGIEDLAENAEWGSVIIDCVKTFFDKKVRLWSFEVKLIIAGRSELRKCFFQAVSNSSWANFGYLVAVRLDGGEEVKRELQMLSSIHGIGFIQLNVEAPEKSEIVFPAKERTEVNWDAANRLADSKDFVKYIKDVRRNILGLG